MLTGNIGEWSELYVLLKLLGDQEIYSANKYLEINPDFKYKILQIVTNAESTNRIEYSLKESADVILIINPSTNQAKEITRQIVKDYVAKVLLSIKNKPKGKRSFSIMSSEEIMNNLNRDSISTTSENKSDLMVKFHNVLSNNTLEGFSIKSYLGGAPTLFNASKQNTNFVFEVINFSGNIEEINSISSRAKIRDRLKKILSQSIDLRFSHIEGGNLKLNLDLLDDKLPLILAELIKQYYQGQGNSIRRLIEILSSYNPLKNDFDDFYPQFYEYKIKNFLLNAAFGMTPARIWNGNIQTNGGFIIVKYDGEIVCFHASNFDELKEYLFDATFIDTPDPKRHDFGYLYSEDKKIFFKLNFQIRFRG